APADAATSPAVALLVELARRTRPGFRLDDGNVEAVAELCHRLDGLPLALELAAPRLYTLGPHELLKRLDAGHSVLAGGPERPPRQRTLHRTLEWTYDLLGGPERALLRRLAVFPGRFGLADVEAVCSDDGLDGEVLLSSIAVLVEAALVER